MTRRDFPRTARRRAIVELLEPRRVLAPLLSLEGPSEVLFEGERAAFTLRLSEPARQAESVFVTTRPGTATPGVDYAASERVQLNFAPGESSKQFFISTLAEAVPRREGNETFFVTARPVNPSLSRALTRQVTIADAVPPPVISVGNITVDEGGYGTTPAVFTLTIGTPFPRPVTVTYATRDGSATVTGDDYTAASGTVTFQPGETSQTVTVNVKGDRILESDEAFVLALSNATNASLSRTTATCTIRNDEIDAPGFQISLNFVDNGFGPVPAVVRQLAAEAAGRWSRIIVGDLPGVSLPGGEFIDDFELTVQMGLLGDPDGTDPIAIANARPLAYRSGSPPLPYQGETGLDAADIGGTLTGASRNWVIDVLAHEIGHAIGFGANYPPFNPFVVGNTFTGANAVAAYRQVFRNSATSVPLQPGIRGHWDEGVFGDELMTPTAAMVGTRMAISRVTIGALQDMGYTVNYGAAEPYSPLTLAPPPASSGGGASNTGSPATGRPPASPAPPPPAVPPQPPSGPPAGLKPGLPPVGVKPGSPPGGGKSTLSRVQVVVEQPLSVAIFAGVSTSDPLGIPRKASTQKAFASLPSR